MLPLQKQSCNFLYFSCVLGAWTLKEFYSKIIRIIKCLGLCAVLYLTVRQRDLCINFTRFFFLNFYPSMQKKIQFIQVREIMVFLLTVFFLTVTITVFILIEQTWLNLIIKVMVFLSLVSGLTLAQHKCI